jgi:hypothetical protein
VDIKTVATYNHALWANDVVIKRCSMNLRTPVLSDHQKEHKRITNAWFREWLDIYKK